MAITDKEINLAQLDQETGGKGLVADFTDPDKKLILASENNDLTEAKLEVAIAAHVANSQQPTVVEKLESLGFSIADLKVALGL